MSSSEKNNIFDKTYLTIQRSTFKGTLASEFWIEKSALWGYCFQKWSKSYDCDYVIWDDVTGYPDRTSVSNVAQICIFLFKIFRFSKNQPFFLENCLKWPIFETKKDLWPELQIDCWTSMQSPSSNQKCHPNQAWCIWNRFCLSLLPNRISITENGILWGWS